MKKVLIIKLGHSETLDSGGDSRGAPVVSLGDVLRTTVILNYFKDARVSWLADKKAMPLLENNPYIKRIFGYNKMVGERLKKESYDLVINLEKSPQICALAGAIHTDKRLGFGVNPLSKSRIALSRQSRRENKDCWQKVLARLVGREWKEEPYILGYKPNSRIKYDIGFNWTTSSKWSNKAWPRAYWDELEALFKGRYSVSWQKGLRGLHRYMDWINSCRLIVSADTLGLHLGLALKKKVVALFGPTPHREIHLYGLGSFLTPKTGLKRLPCLKPRCDKKRQCMEYISPQAVARKIKEEIKYG